MLKALFGGSRFVVGLAVIGTFVGSVVLLVVATLTVFRLAWDEIIGLRLAWDDLTGREPNSDATHAQFTAHRVDNLGVQFIQITDIVLLGTVMYIVSIGLYQLFIDQHLPLPRWLRVHDLIQLKRDLIGVTVVLLGVTFLGEAVDWNSGSDILFLGGAIALVVAALGLILWLTPEPSDQEDASAD